MAIPRLNKLDAKIDDRQNMKNAQKSNHTENKKGHESPSGFRTRQTGGHSIEDFILVEISQEMKHQTYT
jgi:hypothetical protein